MTPLAKKCMTIKNNKNIRGVMTAGKNEAFVWLNMNIFIYWGNYSLVGRGIKTWWRRVYLGRNFSGGGGNVQIFGC